MKRHALLCVVGLLIFISRASAQKPFTLEQVMSAPFPSMACNGRTQVLNCCCGSSVSNAPMQRVQSDASTRVASATFQVNVQEKAAESIPIARRAEGFRKAQCIDTLTLNGLALPPFFERLVPRSPRHEAYLSTEQSAPQAYPRVPCAHGHQGRPQGAGAAPRQGPAQADTLGHGSRALRQRLRNPSLKVSSRARCQGGSLCRRDFACGASAISMPPTRAGGA